MLLKQQDTAAPDTWLSLEQLARYLGGDFATGAYLDKLETTSENSPRAVVSNFLPDLQSYGNMLAAGKANAAANLVKRANSKALTEKLSFGLMQLKYTSELQRAYENSFNCSSFITEENGRYKSKYCHNRWCLVCNRIKTAKYLNEYTPIIAGFKDPRFVTLTTPNPTAKNLSSTLDTMNRQWLQIRDVYRKKGITLKGVRKLEITYNRQSDTYHPHYHIIIESQQHAQGIIEEWIERDKTRNLAAQDERPADEASTKELFKYFTKITSNSSRDPLISLAALDFIFVTLKGKRVFQSFGFVKEPKIKMQLIDEAEPDKLTPDMATINEYSQLQTYLKAFNDQLPQEEANAYFWDSRAANWIDYRRHQGTALTTYTPTKNLLTFESKFIHEGKRTIKKPGANAYRDTAANNRLVTIRARKHKARNPILDLAPT
jgi:plasmid rolling circle replication initiator protein Rep